MRAMILRRLGRVDAEDGPLELADVPEPSPGPGEILIRVATCGVCHTEIDEIEGRTPPSALPRILGHQVVGTVAARGRGATTFDLGARVGVAWIASACGTCALCRRGLENLCSQFRATGRDVDGGYAESMTIAEAFAHAIPDALGDAAAAPLLCAGAIGYRSLRLAGLDRDRHRLGLTGFGASGHLVLRMARRLHPEATVCVFARSERERSFARELGAEWTGDTGEAPPEPLDAVIDTTPAWKPVLAALRHLVPGGRLVINAIRKTDADRDELRHLDYARELWMEKEIKSVANITRRDVREFLELASRPPASGGAGADTGSLAPVVEEYALEEANRALRELAQGGIRGAKVLRVA